MDISKLQGTKGMLPAPAARDVAIPVARAARAPDVFSPSPESLAVSALVQRARVQDQPSESRVAAAKSRLRAGELDGKAVHLATARKMLEGTDEGPIAF